MKKLALIILGFVLLSVFLTRTFPIRKIEKEPTTSSKLEKQTQVSGSSQNQSLILVARVIDGDTIELENGQKVRYIGINAPETVDPRTSVQCFGKEAARANKELVEGKKVRLVKDISETDKYGRLLRYVYQGGTFVNLALVEQGFAYATPYPPDIKYQELFQASQEQAQKNKAGLWSACH